MSYEFRGSEWWLSEIDGGFGENGGIVIDCKHPEYEACFKVAEVWGIDDDTEHDERSRANAQLIAAAPELFEALEEMIGLCASMENPNNYGGAGAYTKARAALEKATGQTQGDDDDGS